MSAIPFIIQAGAQIGSSAINSRAQGQAADKQAEAIEKGIALQQQMYEQDRADFAPYRALGSGAVGNLAYLSGIDLPATSSPTPAPTPTPTTTPMTLQSLGQPPRAPGATRAFNTVAANLNTAEQQYQGPKVKVEYLGQVREIPAILLPRALQQGGKQVS